MDVYKTYCHLRGTSNVEVMQVSVWLVTVPPLRLTPWPIMFFVEIPAPGTAFQCKTPATGLKKNKTKSPPPGIICLVRMPRYRRNRVSFQIFQFSFIMRIKYSQVFIQHVRLILFEVWRQFENHSHCTESQGILQWQSWNVLYTSF